MHAALIVVVALALGCDRAPHGAAPAPETTIELPGDASGAWWESASSTLYLTDDTHHALLRWSGTTFDRVAELPAAKGLGGLVRLADGRFVVVAFGGGTEGGVFVIRDGVASPVPGLDPTRRRTGLALGPDGTIYDSYFTKPPGGESHGGIARLDLEHGEQDVVSTGLVKPIGVAASRLALFVTDQQRGALLAYARTDAAGTETIVSRDVVEPDLMTALPDGDLVFGSKSGVVYRVTPAGSPRTIAQGLGQVRGVAYDPERKRLFVIEHGGAAHTSVLHTLVVE